jgi:inorganic pyrophosphatase
MKLDLGPIGDDGTINVIIETPKGSPNKLTWKAEKGVFELRNVLPAGWAFPFDFGFVPGTKAEDGDPIDVLVLMDEPTWPGTLVSTRLIGVIEAEQEKKGKRQRNDRLIGVAVVSRTQNEVRALEDVSASMRQELEQFFVTFHTVRGEKMRVLGQAGPERARELIEESIRRAA